MRNFRVLFFLLLLHLTVSAQEGASVTGRVLSADDHRPLDKATVSLGDSAGTVLQKILSDSAGRFRFTVSRPGSYSLHVDFIGYAPADRTWVAAINETETGLDLLLQPQAGALQTVIVTAKQLVVENKIDRLVYNVDRDVTSQSGMATDVLKKIPQVSVDANGNVELLGNPSVRFLIDGKPSTLFGNNVADALQSIPASQIQSIEVMSSPGSRYDATGTGGIINIILKKTKAQGFSGIANLSVGTRLENGSVNFTYKHNDISLSGYFSGSDQVAVKTLSSSIRHSSDEASGLKFQFAQDGNSRFKRYGYRTGLGLDWNMTRNDNITVSLSGNGFSTTNDGFFNQLNATYDANNSLLESVDSRRLAFTWFRNTSMDASIDYRKKFKREKEELVFSYQYSNGRNYTSYRQTQSHPADSVFSGSMSANPGRDHLHTISIDYARPLSPAFLLETGLKTELEKLVSNADVYSFDPARYQYVPDPGQSYRSTFDRRVYAAYVSGTFRLFDYLDVIGGLRWEYTTNKAAYSNVKSASLPDYSNSGPSVTLARQIDERQSIHLSYSYRLERPEYRDLNPFVNLSDPHNISTGNPLLRPETGNDFKLSYSKSFENDNALNIVLLYTRNSPDIKSYTQFFASYKVGDSVYDNVNVSTRANIAVERRAGIDVSGSITKGRLTLRPDVQVYNRRTFNVYAVPPKVSGFECRFSLNANYWVAKGLVAEAFGNYRSGTVWQGRQAAFASYTVALHQQLMKGNASVGLVAVNAFSKYFLQKTLLVGDHFESTARLRIPYRSFGISFLYKFGRIKVGKPKEEENLLARPPDG